MMHSVPRDRTRLRRLGAVVLSVLLAATAAPGQTPAAEEDAVRRKVEDFLRRLGDRQVDTLAADFLPNAVIIVSRQRDDGFVNSAQPVGEWLAALRKNPDAPKFREPIRNVRITIDSGHLAHLRADFDVVRDGQVLSSGIDHFLLVKEPDGWKVAAVAYTSLPAQP